MATIVAHKIALRPNNKQRGSLCRAAGVARFSYNWALEEWKKQYQAHLANPRLPKPNQGALRRQLNAIKKDEFPWMLEVTKNAPQMAIIHLGQAFKRFFEKKSSYPTRRKKGRDDRFTLTNDQFQVVGKQIRLPRIGFVRLAERLRFDGKILSATVSREAHRWFVSVTVELLKNRYPVPAKNQGVVGVDLGISSLATLSTGEKVAGPKALRSSLRKLQRYSRNLSRKKKGSRNRKKAREQLARLHARLRHVRQDSLHKLTSDLTSRFRLIGIEDLNVRGMLKNRKLSRAVADIGFHEFRRQLEYKSQWRQGIVVVADRFFPSSKQCSGCGHLYEGLTLGDRQWSCEVCNQTHDRDVNAAMNLSALAVSSTVAACGEESAGQRDIPLTKLASVKQEVSPSPV